MSGWNELYRKTKETPQKEHKWNTDLLMSMDEHKGFSPKREGCLKMNLKSH